MLRTKLNQNSFLENQANRITGHACFSELYFSSTTALSSGRALPYQVERLEPKPEPRIIKIQTNPAASRRPCTRLGYTAFTVLVTTIEQTQ